VTPTVTVRPDGVRCWALFSSCRRWRYSLFRDFTDETNPRRLNVIALNPSTADETSDDPTVHKLQKWARLWGYDGVVVTNIFAWRSTDPKALRAVVDPIGPDNDHWLRVEAQSAAAVLVAWGDSGPGDWRPRDVLRLLSGIELWCLGRTGSGSPRHPSRLGYDTPREVYRAAGVGA
jgi:hypothetical protein